MRARGAAALVVAGLWGGVSTGGCTDRARWPERVAQDLRTGPPARVALHLDDGYRDPLGGRAEAIADWRHFFPAAGLRRFAITEAKRGDAPYVPSNEQLTAHFEMDVPGPPHWFVFGRLVWSLRPGPPPKIRTGFFVAYRSIRRAVEAGLGTLPPEAWHPEARPGPTMDWDGWMTRSVRLEVRADTAHADLFGALRGKPQRREASFRRHVGRWRLHRLRTAPRASSDLERQGDPP